MDILTDYQVQKLAEVSLYLKTMDILFKDLFSQFEGSPFLRRADLPRVPGIYVFYQNDKAIYVGRADDIKQRIAGHTRSSSGHNSANFAFNLTKIEFAEKAKESKMGRQALIDDAEFFDRFSKYKTELSASKLKIIEIRNDILQTMFEPYLALKLGTYPVNNNFDNH